jgi:hypothetical protein
LALQRALTSLSGSLEPRAEEEGIGEAAWGSGVSKNIIRGFNLQDQTIYEFSAKF